MSNLPMSTFNREVVTIHRELKQLEKIDVPVTGYDLVEKWNIAHAKIDFSLKKLHSFALDMDIYENVALTLYELHQRVKKLPYVPDLYAVNRAKNVLALSPHIVVTEDVIEREQEEPELKRVTIMDCAGKIILDQDFFPHNVQEGALPSWNTPTQGTSQATKSLSLTHIWRNINDMLSGHYIIAYDLELIQMQLELAVKRLHLPMPALIGESILDLYFAYLGIDIISAYDDRGDGEMVLVTIYDQMRALFSREVQYPPSENAKRILHIIQGIANCTLTATSTFN